MEASFSAVPRLPLLIRAVCMLLFAAIVPSTAYAQGDDDKHFGVRFSFSPTWKADPKYQEFMGPEGDFQIEGTELTIGFVRGRTRGGEWGVSYLRKPFKDLTVTETQEGQESVSCGTSCTQTFSYSSSTTTRLIGLYLEGAEVHFSIPFVRIKERLQLGLNAGFGFARPKGIIETRSIATSTSTFKVGNNQPVTETDSFDETFTEEAKEEMLAIVPLIKVQAEAGYILAPGLKLKFSGGFNFPSKKVFQIGVVYLIGAN